MIDFYTLYEEEFTDRRKRFVHPSSFANICKSRLNQPPLPNSTRMKIKSIQINVCVPHIICYQTTAQLLYVTWFWSLCLLFNYTSNPPLCYSYVKQLVGFFSAVGGWGFKCIAGLSNVISIIILLTKINWYQLASVTPFLEYM